MGETQVGQQTMHPNNVLSCGPNCDVFKLSGGGGHIILLMVTPSNDISFQ